MPGEAISYDFTLLKQGNWRTPKGVEPSEHYIPQIRLAPETIPDGDVDVEFWLEVRENIGGWLVREN